MATLKRILSEFWVGLVVALGWAIFRAWPFRPEWGWLGAFVANFVTAFFFVSYFTGQFVRIRRQQATEDSFAGMAESLRTVIENQAQNAAAFSAMTNQISEAIAKGATSLPPTVAKELAEANTKFAEANSTIATVLNSLPWQADTPLPLRVQHNPAALAPASDYVPVQSPSQTWPPPKPKVTGTSN